MSALVAFTCPHPYEDHCNPRFCTDRTPYLSLTHAHDPNPVVSRGWAARPQEVSERWSDPIEVVTRARVLVPGDPEPKSSVYRQLKARADRVTYALARKPGKWACTSCGAYCRVKLNGDLYIHKGCEDVTRDTSKAPEYDLLHSVMLRGLRWAVYFDNGKPDFGVIHQVGKVSAGDVLSWLDAMS